MSADRLYPLEDFTPEQRKTLDRFGIQEGIRWDHDDMDLAAVFNEHPALQLVEQLDDDLTGNPDGISAVGGIELADMPLWLLNDLERADPNELDAAGHPLPAFVLARIQDTESVLERVAEQKHLQWIEPFSAGRAWRGVEADRRILVDHLAVHALLQDTGACVCELMRCMAWPNNDHPDWQAEWRI